MIVVRKSERAQAAIEGGWRRSARHADLPLRPLAPDFADSGTRSSPLISRRPSRFCDSRVANRIRHQPCSGSRAPLSSSILSSDRVPEHYQIRWRYHIITFFLVAWRCRYISPLRISCLDTHSPASEQGTPCPPTPAPPAPKYIQLLPRNRSSQVGRSLAVVAPSVPDV